MKKFYESPVVEIAVFDVEDVVATEGSAAVIDTLTDLNTEQKIADAIAAIQGGTYNTGRNRRRATQYISGWNW